MYELVEIVGMPPTAGVAVLSESSDLVTLEKERDRLNLLSEDLSHLRYGIRPTNV